MSYKISISEIIIDPNEQDSYKATSEKEVYMQTTENEIDLKAIIDAFNTPKK